MKTLWKVVIKDREDETKQRTYHGETEDAGTKSAYGVAADKAKSLALRDGIEKPQVDKISFIGKKDF